MVDGVLECVVGDAVERVADLPALAEVCMLVVQAFPLRAALPEAFMRVAVGVGLVVAAGLKVPVL